ncbi:MAG TPA: ABC transporter permease, partial [Verrucomicrobiae bacterium]
MNTALMPVKEPVATPRPAAKVSRVTALSAAPTDKLRFGTLVAVPLASALGIGLHLAVRKNDPEPNTTCWIMFLAELLGVSVVLGIAQLFSCALRRWMAHMCPIIAAALGFFCVWEIITSGFRLLPLPYFPSPASVLRNLILHRDELFNSTWHSLVLLLGGYVLGAALGVITGICIGWFKQARYWGMPLLKVIGPIPATAWIPLAMVISPKAMFSAVGLIALAVWFPVTMLTMSGISNTRASY